MKFAKELEAELVPEWKIKYLNYKAGKKYVKGVARAINKAHNTPKVSARKREPTPRHALADRSSPLATRAQGVNDDQPQGAGALDPSASLQRTPSATGSVRASWGWGGRASGDAGPSTTGPGTATGSVLVPQTSRPATESLPVPTRTESQSLTKSPGNEGRYGSFVPTPPVESPLTTTRTQSTFELPAPAIRIPSNVSQRDPDLAASKRRFGRLAAQRSASMTLPMPGRGGHAAAVRPGPNSAQETASPLRRLFSATTGLSRTETYKLESDVFDVVRHRENEFFNFLDSELDKVETFYKQKEEQAGQRLAVLRAQLHEMRNRRTEELAETRRLKEHGDPDGSNGKGATRDPAHWIDPIRTKIFRPGPNSKAMLKMPISPENRAKHENDGRDYTRRPQDDVPYRTAKHKLKLALQEFYRGLELLKSYALLNRTAFRKLNKKYDKAVHARPPYRYMNEKVNKSWFVNSDIVDGHVRAVEDLYARYFEKGNHKIAAGKLRRLSRRPGDESGSTFVNGLFIGTGACFAIQGLVYGAELLFDPDPTVRTQTSYLLQIYGGYFLMLYLFSLFCVNCYVWTKNKVNYPFIFEFDTRNNLDWRQLSQFPSFCLLLLGIFLWLNFTRYGSPDMFLYYPVLLVFITLVLILLPAPILAHRSRKWFVYSHYRLFFAGVFPVEFRDFFLGDMYCSLAYAISNVELFFCLYAHYWNDPTQCNSNHSRLLGFFNTLPAIWRALQCIRRYVDTNNIFPHLVNCGKYGMTIMSYVFLSLYRIQGTKTTLALYVTFSIVNGIYTSVWDLLMDFSILQPDSRYRFLRDILALKRRWVYYVIMVLDPILRFNWIFYAIYTYDKQHSTVASFLIGFSEVTRRGMWALIRVENEHCSNVAQYKASRDIPLPYQLEQTEPLTERLSASESARRVATAAREEAAASSVDITSAGAAERRREAAAVAAIEAGQSGTSDAGGMRRRRQSSTVFNTAGGAIRKTIAEAHKQDYEKKRKPVDSSAKVEDDGVAIGLLRSDDDDDSGSDSDERMDARQAEDLTREDSDDER